MRNMGHITFADADSPDASDVANLPGEVRSLEEEEWTEVMRLAIHYPL